ncbi:MAG: enoyl-CoA hydratase [Lysobacteraceae bacterium]|nr:MAG: enoyl-CoA hydratase [Xanthomonadaceae bacterium]
MTESRVSLRKDGGIAYVTLDRAEKRNALDMAMFRALDRVSREIRKVRDVRVVIVHAQGEDFCSGLDVKSVMGKPSSVLSLLAKWWPGSANLAQRVSTNWKRIPAPVLMVIHGRCWGGGLQIALGGDFRIATPDASFSIMEAKWGLVPDMGGNLAVRDLLPKDMAMRLAMTAEVIDAKSALKHALITEVCDDPMQRAKALAAELIERSPDAVAAVKKLYQRNWQKADWVLLAKESYYQLRLILGKNQRRAVGRQLSPEKNISYLDRKRW